MKKIYLIAAAFFALPQVAAAGTVSAVNDYASALTIADPGSTVALPTGASWTSAPLLVSPPPANVGGIYRSPFETAAAIDSDYTGLEDFFTVGNGPAYAGTGNPAVLLLSGLTASISLLWGSPDSYNTMELWSGGSLVGSVTGDAFNSQAVEASWVTYTAGAEDELFDTVKFYSNARNAFEFSNIVALSETTTPVPLPAAGFLLIAGLGALGATRRRK